jgi:hypothetical protein
MYFQDEAELKSEVREFTGYTSTMALSADGLTTAYRTAKRHIQIKKSLEAGYTWFKAENGAVQDALFWFTCLFTRVETGELDSQDFQAGGIEKQTLLAKDDTSVTSWYRNATSALENIKPTNTIRSTSPARSGRSYEADSYEGESGTGASGGSTEVDGSDI